jgi:hypothetical protein
VSSREIAVHRLVGRRVRDPAGRSVGRIEELICEIELHERGRDYVVRDFRVGTFGPFDVLAGSSFAREMLRTLGRVFGYRQLRVGWQRMDLTDPARPRLRSTD